MNHKSITPNPQQPVDRVPTGQLPSALSELSEAALNVLDSQAHASGKDSSLGYEINLGSGYCSYGGDDE